MIINVTYGGSASDAARYIGGAAKEHGRDVPGTEDRAALLGSQGFGFSVQTQDDVRLALAVLRRDVELQASNTKPVENTVIHASMSWPQGYEPSREEMLEASEHLAKAWGMEAHRRISWSHEETKHRHTHTIFGSIHPDTGYAHHDHELNDRAQRAAIEFERKYGIPPTRQKDHDKAAAAEASDHTRTMDLSRNTDGSILRRSLDRALSLGGHFGPDKTAQRNEFIKQNDLTRFPQHSEQAYAPPEVAREKRDYVRDNHAASSDLARAYKREAKERERGVAGLYEDHSFEKTSKPPPQEGREANMGLTNDLLDWPWKKAGEIIRGKWKEIRDERNYRKHVKDLDKAVQRAEDKERASRDFGKEVEEKGWNDPGVRRSWEKKYGHAPPEREEKREPSWEKPSSHPTQESRLAKHFKDMEARPRPERPQPLPPSPEQGQRKKTEAELAAEMEKARVENWRTQRERNGNPTRASETPPWTKDEQRSDAWRREQEIQKEEVDSRPPVLPRPREIPMPKIEPRDRAPQERETKWDKEFREREREGKAEGRFQDGIDKAANQQEPKNMDWRRVTKEHDRDVENWGPEIEKHRQRFEKEHPRSPAQGHPAGRVYDALDKLDPPTPAQVRGDLNASAGAPQSFQQQLDQSLRDIKPPKREIGKDRERER